MKNIAKEAIEIHKRLLSHFEDSGIDTVIEIAEAVIKCFKSGGCLYLCGNGGSAADCQHIAAEMVGRFKMNRKALPAVAFSTDTSIITSVSNDYGFEDIFRRQTEGLVNKADILWAFSTSGSSPNVLSAVELAKEKGAVIIAFTGKSKSKLEEMADICLCIDAPDSSNAQEIHQLAYHIICDLVEQEMNKN
jgi:D-sedoheptulose 7-phosphate isomerase